MRRASSAGRPARTMPDSTHRPRMAISTAMRDGSHWRRTLLLGLPIGLLQVALNQGDHWWRHQVDAAVVAKSILSPLLSCSIAFASSVTRHPLKKPDLPSS